MSEPTDNRAASLVIESGWLCDSVGHHTCAGGTPESNGAHEPGCGLEPLMKVEDLVALFDALTTLGLPINRASLLLGHVEQVKREAGEAALAPFHALFSGEPDTPCRTTWRKLWHTLPTEPPEQVECVEVPIDELRDTFDEAERVIEGQA